ncbi:DUF2500 domain-containing protein [Paenibacillus lutrae]|uniref:DUF2500 family protein n=1 Tax=Paenibacillus lutrae TaxID=2078573 RepID=A0A7X3JYF8_9BACL|nr:DUF2500 domain-containing protein [Paenibacillus lutrae]MVO99031.1 DUF2500 family protein [Paenibacillus lutrae]
MDFEPPGFGDFEGVAGNGFPLDAFGLFGIVFMIVFLLIAGLIIFSIIKAIGQWSHNNKQPVLSVYAVITAKRTHVSRRSNSNSNDSFSNSGSTSTTYYATFEVESGDRLEFAISGQEYGQLMEGDTGKLTFQGTRYLGYERSRAVE